MYIPTAFEEKRLEVLHEFMRSYSFAMVVTAGDELFASHLPFLLDAGRGKLGTLRSHVARANPHWQAFNGEREALVIFQGPHAYISPSYYQTKLSVPTWNYVAIHAYGRPKIIEDAGVFRALLKETVDLYEAGSRRPWMMEALPEEFTGKLQQQIVGFEIEITRLEGKFKLNQNRTVADRQGVVEALNKTGDPGNAAVAKLIVEGM